MKNIFLILLSCFVFYSCQTPKPAPVTTPGPKDVITEKQANEMILAAFTKYYGTGNS